MNDLQLAIQNFFNKPDIDRLKKFSDSLTMRYRNGETLRLHEELHAYLAVRLPATFAAMRSVLSRLPTPGSILDIGAGPGTSWWAARSIWAESFKITAYEREPKFIELGKKLAPLLSNFEWIEGDVCALKNFDPHDWVVFGYSLGEMPKENLSCLLKACWRAAQKGIVIVEPGTPIGYQRILLVRDLLVKEGGYILAPCPHANVCPLQHSWCHFSVRVERSTLHRQLKHGSLGFEDEKFSYLIVTKEKNASLPSRIIDHPAHHKGHSILSLCTSSGIKKITISRSQKELYKKARKAGWGDDFC